MKSLRGAAGLLAVSSLAFAQTPAAEPKPAALQFEVATIKPAAPPNPAMFQAGKLHVGMNIDAARVDIGFLSLADLMQAAFKVKLHQISGPDWMAAQRFDILAKMPEGATKDDVPQMLQGLLADRFKLTYHRESKEQSVYALVVGKNGPKLKDSPPDEPEPAADAKDPNGTTTIDTGNGAVKITQSRNGEGAVATVKNKETGTTKMSMGPNGTMHMEASKVTMSQFADLLSRFMDKPVVDMTDLKGSYQVAIDLSMDDLRGMARKAGVTIPAGGPGGPGAAGGDAGARAGETASEPSGASIFMAVQQLGLKLDARKAPIDLIVIDHLEKVPTEN